jgi:hypothetical protein
MNEKQLREEIEKLYVILEKKEQKWDYKKPFEEYQEYVRPERKKLNELGRQLRLIQSFKLNELSDFGDVMSMEHFIECVECGGFIDYDGFGHYVKDGQESDIEIYPSDVKHNMVRKDFDTIIWFNR